MREQLLKRRAGNLRSTLKASNDKQQKLELEWLKLRMRRAAQCAEYHLYIP